MHTKFLDTRINFKLRYYRLRYFFPAQQLQFPEHLSAGQPMHLAPLFFAPTTYPIAKANITTKTIIIIASSIRITPIIYYALASFKSYSNLSFLLLLSAIAVIIPAIAKIAIRPHIVATTLRLAGLVIKVPIV